MRSSSLLTAAGHALLSPYFLVLGLIGRQIPRHVRERLDGFSAELRLGQWAGTDEGTILDHAVFRRRSAGCLSTRENN